MPDQKSNALPLHAYADPALVVERNQLRELGCRACFSHLTAFGKVYCSNPKKKDHSKVPFVGSKCNLFELKD